jgi:hypothetical protein
MTVCVATEIFNQVSYYIFGIKSGREKKVLVWGLVTHKPPFSEYKRAICVQI